MSLSPLISVIIPAYNSADHIARTIQSVQVQTEQRFEIVIVDDASSDNTVEVIRSFSDEKIHLHINERNRGVSYGRNHAIKMARGEWIALLDSDDWYAPERLEKMLQSANQFGADVIADDLYLVPANSDARASRALNGAHYEMGRLFSKKLRMSLPRQLTAAEFLHDNMPDPNRVSLGLVKPLIRREFLTRHGIFYDEDVTLCEDTVLYLACIAHGARFMFIAEPYYYYQKCREGSIISNFDPMAATIYKYQINCRLLREYGASDPEIKDALLLRHRALEKLMAYYRLKLLAQKGSMADIWKEVSHSPAVVGFLAYKVALKIRRIPKSLKAYIASNY